MAVGVKVARNVFMPEKKSFEYYNEKERYYSRHNINFNKKISNRYMKKKNSTVEYKVGNKWLKGHRHWAQRDTVSSLLQILSDTFEPPEEYLHNLYDDDTLVATRWGSVMPLVFGYLFKMEEEIDELEQAHMIGKTLDLPYGFPLVIVKKKIGSFRSRCDFRSINKMTAVPQYPMPRLEDMVAAMRNKPYLAVINMAKAYLQLPVAKEDYYKTTFVCKKGAYFHY